ncbi:hypothetical protein PSMA106859_19820 [Pseudoalteromonas maricaloris]
MNTKMVNNFRVTAIKKVKVYKEWEHQIAYAA